MEGVAISVRGQGQTITTSVYTNQHGQYFFPPLASGGYNIWAQAVGFQTSRSEIAISPGVAVQQNFNLTVLQDFQKQLSGTEWANSFPSNTPDDLRMMEEWMVTRTA